MDFIRTLLSSDVVMASFILGFCVVLVAFLLIQSRLNRKMRESTTRDFLKAQENLFADAAESFAERLNIYTDSVLVDRMDSIYNKLAMQNLLPAVEDAAKTVAELSQTVVQRQEQGMVELADVLAELFAAKTREAIGEQTQSVASLQESIATFSRELSGVTQTVELLSARYNEVYHQAASLSEGMSSSVETLGSKAAEFGTLLDKSAETVMQMQEHAVRNSDAVESLTEATVQMQQMANDSSVALSVQTEKTAALLAEAVHAMQNHAEISAEKVLSGLTVNLGSTTELVDESVTQLKEISENIRLSASQFADSLSGSYQRFGEGLDDKLESVTQTLGQSLTEEYQKIMLGVSDYSNNFSQSISSFDSTLEGHINNLQLITQMLNSNVSSFNDSVDTSSTRFELGMEKTIADAMGQMDRSLADIVRRLVSVASSIQEAADALPSAIQSIREQGGA